MNLVWKLLRKHISVGQFCGFFFANLCGMFIVLLSIQFYKDVLPVFTQGDSFMKKDYVIISKPVSTIGSLIGRKSGFAKRDIEEMKLQPFIRQIGEFTSSQFHVTAGIGDQNLGINMSTQMFFESVPDNFIDVKKDNWTFDSSSHEIPIILPRDYLNLYNFGFAKSRNLPQLTENLVKMASLDVTLSGNGQKDNFKGKLVGFSSRLNTILVPESFMKWANGKYASDKKWNPSRLILEVNNPADERIVQYFQKKGYETEKDKLDASKTTWFLKIVVGVVLAIGLVISILSFYILMLSVFLLLQKNTTKLENLLLIGYSPSGVAKPYQWLTILLNLFVFICAVALVIVVRYFYIDALGKTFPALGSGGIILMVVVGFLLFTLVSVLNCFAIRRKIRNIWHSHK